MRDDGPSTRIAPITLDDVEGFHAALDSVARERRFLASFEAPPLEAAQVFVEANLREGNPHFVAHEGGRIVGWCDIKRSGRPVHAHCGVMGMGVVADCRGAGIGRALLGATRAAGLLRVDLDVRAANTPAIALYERMGFRHEGRKVAAYNVDGAFDDLLVMGLVWPEGAAG